jgi:hypothetical protein
MIHGMNGIYFKRKGPLTQPLPRGERREERGRARGSLAYGERASHARGGQASLSKGRGEKRAASSAPVTGIFDMGEEGVWKSFDSN